MEAAANTSETEVSRRGSISPRAELGTREEGGRTGPRTFGQVRRRK